MSESLLPSIFAWASLVVLFLLCLLGAWIRKLILEIAALIVRLGLLALLVLGGILWFRPDWLPPEVASTIQSAPQLAQILPEPSSQLFGPVVCSVVVALLLPCLAVLDVTRKLAGNRLNRLRALSAAPVVEQTPATAGASQTDAPEAQAKPKRVDRRSAAESMAAAGSRKPFRVADHLS